MWFPAKPNGRARARKRRGPEKQFLIKNKKEKEKEKVSRCQWRGEKVDGINKKNGRGKRSCHPFRSSLFSKKKKE